MKYEILHSQSECLLSLVLLGPIPTVLNINLCSTRSVHANIFWHSWDQSQQRKIFTYAPPECACKHFLAVLGPIPTELNIDFGTTRSVYAYIFKDCWDQSQQCKIFTYAQLGSVHKYISWHCWDIPNSIKLNFGCVKYIVYYFVGIASYYVICATWECV